MGEAYDSYENALKICDLETLDTRRERRCLNFALKCLKYPKTQRLFPVKEISHNHLLREKEHFVVNFARTEAYRTSAVPYCQRLLNDHSMTQ